MPGNTSRNGKVPETSFIGSQKSYPLSQAQQQGNQTAPPYRGSKGVCLTGWHCRRTQCIIFSAYTQC